MLTQMRTYIHKGYKITYEQEKKEWLGIGNDEAIRAKRKKDIIKAINGEHVNLISREWI